METINYKGYDIDIEQKCSEVYGFTISENGVSDLGDTGMDGFYGYNHEKSGLLAEARACIDAMVEEAA